MTAAGLITVLFEILIGTAGFVLFAVAKDRSLKLLACSVPILGYGAALVILGHELGWWNLLSLLE